MTAPGQPDNAAADPPGIRLAPVTEWICARVPEARPPFTFSKIAGGHSNLTYLVTDTTGFRLVLRRPPLSHVLASAHDMGREHRILAALGPTDVPVPEVVGLCEDPDVNDSSFYVMRFVDGLVVRDAEVASQLSVSDRRHASESLVDTLIKIHALDVDAVGLGQLGRKENYIARQLKRWYGQFQQMQTRPIPAMDEVHAALAARIPEQREATLVHGDYRLDNSMVDRRGEIIAVLDWEICTLGDPLADLGLLMVYWAGPGDEPTSRGTTATPMEGFMTRAELADRYAARSGRDLTHLPFYTAFANFKLACIIEGVYTRYLGGALGDASAEELAPFAMQTLDAAQRALDALR